MKYVRNWLLLLLLTSHSLQAAVWQWSALVPTVISGETNDHPRAFLWIPSNCKQVRAVVVGQHNMTEETIFEHPAFRKTMAELGFAIVWVTPAINMVFDFNNGAGEQFDDMMDQLAKVSGYNELRFAPVVPIGHSACASYPWNFGAWNPERTLAILSIHGDAPQTNLTGSGKPNPAWANRTTSGVPALMVEGEYEWWEDRVSPCFAYQQRIPDAPVSFLADAGHGHFDISDALVDYLDLFLKKAAYYRLPKIMPMDQLAVLVPVFPKNGWLADRWHPDGKPHAEAAPNANYQGDRTTAFWYFDQETALATEKLYAAVRGKKEPYIGFEQKGRLLTFNPKLHARITPTFEPDVDGVTFHIKAVFTDTLRTKRSSEHGRFEPVITRICGPVSKVNDTTFTLQFYRMGMTSVRRSGDIWLIAASKTDKRYKSAVQQVNIRIPLRNTEGLQQTIEFVKLSDIKVGIRSVTLKAHSDCDMPVQFYVQEGPAEIKKDKLVITKIPPRSKFPVKVTVVAWQYGRSTTPKIQSAEPVVQSFHISK
jgi:hypothetical protein